MKKILLTALFGAGVLCASALMPIVTTGHHFKKASAPAFFTGPGPYGQVTTLAGSGTAGNANGTGTAATFNRPFGVAADAAGNIYVADGNNNVIRKITIAGVVTTFAGSGIVGSADGTATAASFRNPTGTAVDAAGNVYVADYGNNKIRKITSAGVVTTFAGSGKAGSADGTGIAATFIAPYGITVAASGNIFVADYGDNKVRKITTGAVVTTLAGSGTAGSANGTGAAASFKTLRGLTSDASNNVYVADAGNNLIRKITSAGVVTTFAGSGAIGSADGTGTAASFRNPSGVAADAAGNIFVADAANNRIRIITPAGVVTTLAGSTSGNINGTGTGAKFNEPIGVCIDNKGNLAVSEYPNNLIRLVSITEIATPPTISYPASTYRFAQGVAIAPQTPTVSNGSIPADAFGRVNTFAATSAANIAADGTGNVYFTTSSNAIMKIAPNGTITTLAGSNVSGRSDGTGPKASLRNPMGMAVSPGGNIYVADYGNNEIRKITPGGAVTTLAGNGSYGYLNGTGATARFQSPSSCALDPDGNLIVLESQGARFRKITADGVVTTLTLNSTVSFKGFAIDASGNIFANNNTGIYKITPAGVVTLFAGQASAGGYAEGQGTNAMFNGLYGISIDSFGYIYVGDSNNQRVRMISPNGTVTTLAGSGSAGNANGTGANASFNIPMGVSINGASPLYVIDNNNSLIRKISTSGFAITPDLPVGFTFNRATGTIQGKPQTSLPLTPYTVTGCNDAGCGVTSIFISASPGGPDISYPGPQIYTAGTAIPTVTPNNSGQPVPAIAFATTTTLAGSGSAGNANGMGTAASFNRPFSVASDVAGNTYVADGTNNLIRKITPDGAVTTFAGSGAVGSADGTGAAASFRNPTGVAVDATGNVYVADYGNNKIRKITPAGVVTTLAGSGSSGSVNGAGAAATFTAPYGLAVSAQGNIYVTDYGDNKVRMVTPAGVVTTLAGAGTSGRSDGTGASTSFNNLRGITIDPSGNIYVADAGNNRIRKITQAGVVTTFAGTTTGYADGAATVAKFNYPTSVTADAGGNIYVADTKNDRIRMISPAGLVSTIAGNTAGHDNGMGAGATFNQPTGICADGLGNVLVSDFPNNLIRKVVITGYSVTPALPPGLTLNAVTGAISGTPSVASGAADYTVTATNTGGSSRAVINITIIVPAIAPKISYNTASVNYTVGATITPLNPSNSGGAVPAVGVGKMTVLAGSSTVGAADGVGAAASFNGLGSITADRLKNIYVIDAGNQEIRKITPSGVVTTVVGSTIAGLHARSLASLAVDVFGNLFIATGDRARVFKITPDGTQSLYLSLGQDGLDDTGGLAADALGNIYIVNYPNDAQRAYINGYGPEPRAYDFGSLDQIYSITVDGLGNMLSPNFGDGVYKATTTINGSPTRVIDNKYATGGITSDKFGNIYTSSSTTIYRTGPSFGTPSPVVNIASGAFTTDDDGYLYVVYGNAVQKVETHGYYVSPALPPGLLMDSATGIISGTPTALSVTTDYTITAFNAGGNSSAVITIGVTAPNQPDISYAGDTHTFTKNTAITPLTPTNAGGAVPAETYKMVSTFAGTGVKGASNGDKASATFYGPTGGTFDQAGNMYVADTYNNLIRKITPDGVVTTFAGSGVAGSTNGTGTAASFNAPFDITIDASGNLYVSDSQNNKIRKITPGGVVTDFAGNGVYGNALGSGATASFRGTAGLTIDDAGNVYVADIFNNRICKITPDASAVTLVAGDTNSDGDLKFFNPAFIVRDGSGNFYVSQSGAEKISMISSSGEVSTIAGSGNPGSADGNGTTATFFTPMGLVLEPSGNLYVADAENQLIRQISLDRTVSTFAGVASNTATPVDGIGTQASFLYPVGLLSDDKGDFYVFDQINNNIRKISINGYSIDKPLPAGLNFDSTTGTISGTPTETIAATTYTVTAYNKNGNGTAVVKLGVEPASMFMANNAAETLITGEPQVHQLLSPNGDGNNDVLIIENIDQYPTNKVAIMDVNGTLVYQAAGYGSNGKGFDGHSSVTGKMQNPGTYFYQLEYSSPTGAKRKAGYFVIKY